MQSRSPPLKTGLLTFSSRPWGMSYAAPWTPPSGTTPVPPGSPAESLGGSGEGACHGRSGSLRSGAWPSGPPRTTT
eukprot:6530252-Alexandrium_andersonii.AAC.1